MRSAIDMMIDQGLRWDDAAVKSGMTTRNMRLALERPHVRAYLKAAKQVALERASAANIHRLTQIRDAADNMPAVNAIRMLEELGSEQLQRSNSTSITPGVVIRIVTTSPQPPTIDVTPHTDGNDIKTIDGSER